MIKYGIRKIGEEDPLTYFTRSNEGHTVCVAVEYVLSDRHCPGGPMWLVNTIEEARNTLKNPSPWYNADYETPNHSITNVDDYELVGVVLACAVVV